MGMARIPSKFFKPLAAGAPTPFIEKPVRLERMIQIMAAVGDKLDVLMLPKVEGPWDIPRPASSSWPGLPPGPPAGASPRMHGMSLGPIGKNAIGGVAACQGRRGERCARLLPAGPLALYRWPHGGCVRGVWHQAVLRPVRGFLGPGGLRSPIPQCLSSRVAQVSHNFGLLPGCIVLHLAVHHDGARAVRHRLKDPPCEGNLGGIGREHPAGDPDLGRMQRPGPRTAKGWHAGLMRNTAVTCL